jgi:cytoskeletal protein CcmA (bactofilin family)
MDTPKSGEFAHIGKSVVIKGELSGSEDLYVDGVVEGTIELQGNNLVIGPNGQVRAKINAKSVVVQGKLEGNIQASERAELRKSAVAVGDILTKRIAIEDGAYFKGKVDIQKDSTNVTRHQADVKSTSAPAVGAAASGAVSSGGAALPATAGTPITKY